MWTSQECLGNFHAVTDTAELGMLIKAERKRQKLTQVRLAAFSGVGVRFLRELEGGKTTGQIGLIFAVMRGLSLEVFLAAGDRERIL